jgi:hypothetical protein
MHVADREREERDRYRHPKKILHIRFSVLTNG